MAVKKRPTERDLHWIKADLSPVAHCVNGDPEFDEDHEQHERCAFRFPNGYGLIPYSSSEITRAAKRHALSNPGHLVQVTRRTVARYLLEPEGDDDAG